MDEEQLESLHHAIYRIHKIGLVIAMMVFAAGMGLYLFGSDFASHVDKIGCWLLVLIPLTRMSYVACWYIKSRPKWLGLAMLGAVFTFGFFVIGHTFRM